MFLVWAGGEVFFHSLYGKLEHSLPSFISFIHLATPTGPVLSQSFVSWINYATK